MEYPFSCAKRLTNYFAMWYINIAMKDNFIIDDFILTYKGTRNFCDTEYFKAFYDSLDDDELYSHIVFNNDVLQLPPILTFVKYRQSVGDELFCKPINKTDKRCLGACFGYLFKNILGYKLPVPTWVGEQKSDIKNASYFVREEK